MALANFNYITQTTKQFQINTADTTSIPGYSWTAYPSTGIYNPGVNMIGFVNNGSETLRIIQSGSIGIGAGAVSDPSAAILLISAGTSLPITRINQTGIGDGLDVQIASISKLIVTNSGRVGINTAIPAVQLHSWSSQISNAASYTPNLMGIFPIAILEEQLAGAGITVTGTGTSTIRQLNSIITDSLGSTVSLNTGANNGTFGFTLPIGSYFIQAEGNAAVATAHRLLLSSTAGVTGINVYGTSEVTSSATISSKSTISTVLSLSSATTFQLRTVSTGNGTLGQNTSIGGNNTYSRVIVTRFQ